MNYTISEHLFWTVIDVSIVITTILMKNWEALAVSIILCIVSQLYMLCLYNYCDLLEGRK